MKVDFIFDFASPNAYCCHKVIPEIQDRTGIKFNYILNGDNSNKYYIICLKRREDPSSVDTNNYCDNIPAFFKKANISNY